MNTSFYMWWLENLLEFVNAFPVTSSILSFIWLYEKQQYLPVFQEDLFEPLVSSFSLIMQNTYFVSVYMIFIAFFWNEREKKTWRQF